ncbi:MAG: hypothetical protein IJF65_07055 [Clostridia bacterium]|nr:hypothetical protein [Clostridia bacterium]
MYTPNDLNAIETQLRRRIWAMGIPGGILLAGIVVSVLPSIRLQWLTVALTIALGVLIIFGYGMFLSPLCAYRDFLKNALYSPNHPLNVIFKSLKQDPCLRDGVVFYPMMVSEGNPDDEEDDRLFYYDIQKPLPQLEPGTPLHIVYHDKSIIALDILK